jgi:tetratricopeptide (TPR) repeat protein
LPRIGFLLTAGAGIALVVLLSSAGAATAQQGAMVHPMDSQLEALHRAGEYSRAVEIIRPALERTPDDHYLLCKIADNLTDWARISPEKEQEPLYEEAVAFAEKAVELDTTSALGWFQFGKAYGRLALFRGGKTKVNMSKDVKIAFERAIELDPQHAGSLHGLARWHREVANLSWLLKLAAKIIYGGLPPASNEEAVVLFKRALEIEPEMITHHLELGKTYLEMKEKDLARAEFEQVLALPEGDADDPDWKAEAEKLMKKVRR